jgi:hypothetical protein
MVKTFPKRRKKSLMEVEKPLFNLSTKRRKNLSKLLPKETLALKKRSIEKYQLRDHQNIKKRRFHRKKMDLCKKISKRYPRIFNRI